MRSSSSTQTPTPTSTPTPNYHVCVLGAGIVGCSIAHSLSRQPSPPPNHNHHLRIALIDPAPPLSLTSSLSTGGFRSFYPADHTMTALASRSILILQALSEESIPNHPTNVPKHEQGFEFTRAGYLLCSKDKENWKMYKAVAQASENVGGGPLRFHHSFDSFSTDSYHSQTHGFDIITDTQIIQSLFPSLNHEIQTVCHVRNAGYLNVVRLGKFLLKKSIHNGVNLITAKALDITYSENDKTYTIKLSNGESITSKSIVLALGPHIINFMKDVFDVDIPLFNEVHGKTLYTFPSPSTSTSIQEDLAAPSLPMPIPPSTPIIPFTIYTDSVPSLFFSDSEKQLLQKNGLEWLINLNEPRPHCRGLTRGEREDLEKQGFVNLVPRSYFSHMDVYCSSYFIPAAVKIYWFH
ncbi:FAD dependent oxidoreductase-domain-containing protein [Paraphysoderma sedebokerense]|nr:FAD dependent oxidoreductase-domain-containing protein [Paraphysoderma sedebokerense]